MHKATFKQLVPNKHFRSSREREIERWLVEQNYNVRHNCLDVLDDKEIDIFLPDHNIAFEFNGVAFHWNKFNGHHTTAHPHPKEYHKLKTIGCLRKGIALYHFWDFEPIANVKDNITQILRGRVLSEVNVDKNPYLVTQSVLIPLYYISENVYPYKIGVVTKCPTIWNTTRNTVYKFYNAGFVINSIVHATL